MNPSTKLSPLLVEAKDQYVRQLAEITAPFVIHTVNAAYKFAKQTTRFGNTNAEFQKKLREIPRWNSTTISQQTTAIKSKYPFVTDLIAACFVSYVKIMSSVQIHAHRPNIRLKLPSDDAFLHRVFGLSAKEFYDDPELVKADRSTRLAVVQRSVETAVRELLPIHDILKAYLGATVDEEGVNTDRVNDDDDDAYESPSPVASSASSSPYAESRDALSRDALSRDALRSGAPSPQFAPSPPQFVPSPPPNHPSSGSGQAETMARLQQLLETPLPQPSAPAPPASQPHPSPAPSIRVPLANPGAFVTPLGFDDAQGDRFFR